MKDLFGGAQSDRINGDDVAIEMQSTSDSGSGSSEMKSFFSEIASINNQIATFQGNVSRIQELHSKNLTAVSEEEMARYSSDIDKLVDESNSIANRLRNTLKAMDKSNEAFEAKNPGSGDARIRKSQHAMQSKKFVEVLQNYQQIQSENKDKYQKRMARQIRIVKPDATEEEVSNIMKDGSKSLFALQIAPDSQLAQANETLRRMEERHIEIEKLERSIIELHQLFVDMAVLVDQQSHMIANIDTYVSNAVQYTNKAAENLRKANNSQKKSRKRMCCILICAVIFIVIIIAILGGLKVFSK